MANLTRQILINTLGDLYEENKTLFKKYNSKRYLFPKKPLQTYDYSAKTFDFIDSLDNLSVKELKQQIKVFSSDNKKLVSIFNKAQYKAADFIIDSAYSFVKRRNKPERPTLCPLALKKTKSANSNRVDIINHNFYDWKGKTVFKGGAERYVFDLCQLLKKLGYTPRIIQGADSDFSKKYRGIEVIGIKGIRGDFRDLSTRFNDYCRDSAFVIASPLELACEITSVPCIGINHGVNFDGLSTEFDHPQDDYYKLYKDALRNAAASICVDTNFINWFRTKDYRLSCKLFYIPNYYDEAVFNPSLFKKDHNAKKLRFVYPRRIYSPRGYDITIAAFRRLLNEGTNVEVAFIGQYDNNDCKKNVESFISEFPDSVSHEEYAMEDAYLVYKNADVVLVPTRHSEGTSLSCIEAQALGIPVISTNVGGLPNIIIDHYNGLLISPTSDAIHDAVLELANNKKLRDKMSEHALEIASSSFRKANWDKKWTDMIESLVESLQ